MDAYRELQQLGRFDQLGLKLLYTFMREEVRRFPVLEPGAGWTEDSVWEWVQSFFVAKGPQVTDAVLAQTAGLPSMERYLRRSIRNFLVSEARKTPVGSVRRKIEELLAATPKFDQVPSGTPGAGRWQLIGVQYFPYAGELRPLVAAAYSVPGVRAVRWSGERRAPLASDESLIAILEAVFSAAAGSLEVAELTWIFLQRFPAAAEFADAMLDQLAFDLAVAPFEDRPDVLVEVGERAREVYAQLSPSQRVLLPHLHKPVSDHMQVLGVGRTQAFEATRKLKAVLGELVPDDDLGENVILEVLRLCLIAP
ncbi:hypothetical protein ABGB17_17490 [Sphaerisporangium sp. B11E5]|uniref:hypothetical protein n=1 Tax=Sphaerisporangium sp. B11E5 TaxID=3153563 RepID=UPI00325E2B56